MKAVIEHFSQLESPSKATSKEGCAEDSALSSSGEPSSSSVRRMKLDEVDEVDEGHADKVQKVDSRSGIWGFNKVIKPGAQRSNWRNESLSIMQYWSMRSARAMCK